MHLFPTFMLRSEANRHDLSRGLESCPSLALRGWVAELPAHSFLVRVAGTVRLAPVAHFLSLSNIHI